MYKLDIRPECEFIVGEFFLVINANVGLFWSAILNYKLLQARSDHIKSIIIEGLAKYGIISELTKLPQAEFMVELLGWTRYIF